MTTIPDGVDPSRYTNGRDRYVHFAQEVLGLELGRVQKEILRALTEHDRILVVSGNGVGKSYTAAVAMLAYLATNVQATILGTSGSYSQFVDAAWRPLKRLHSQAQDRVGLPGTAREGGQPELRIDDEWYAKIVSPRDPGDLEGRHAEHMLVVVEEADKAYITQEHFDSAGSSITDSNDRMLAVANPPTDESNVVYDKMQSDRWHTIQFSSFDSRNVRVDAGEHDGPKIPGLIDTETIREDWEAWNAEPWPGLEAARDAHERRTDLDERWYRRRAGVIPPAAASAYRPISRSAVESAFVTQLGEPEAPPEATAVDVARAGGDETVAKSVTGTRLWTRYAEQGTDHMSQADALQDELGSDRQHPIAVDAVGEGSGLADILQQRLGRVIRFNAGGTPAEGAEFYDCWSEGLYHLGQWLDDGGQFADRRLREELLVAARTVEFEERHMASRGQSGAEVLKATPKSELKDRLGRSPDHLDAAMMAVWARDAGVETTVPTARATFGDDETDDTGDTDERTVGDVLPGL